MTSPDGATTNRISSSIGRTSRLTAHIRMVADLSVRGPWSRSGSVSQSEHACLVAPVICARSARRKDFRFCGTPALRRLVFGGLGRLGLLGEFGLGDPAGNDAGLHDHALGIVAR